MTTKIENNNLMKQSKNYENNIACSNGYNNSGNNNLNGRKDKDFCRPNVGYDYSSTVSNRGYDHSDNPSKDTSRVTIVRDVSRMSYAEKESLDVKIIENGLVDLGQELEEGNIEFKLKLVDPSPERLEQLVTQLKWRLLEGHGEAFYEIGVEDSGYPRGLNDYELGKSIETIKNMAKAIECEAFVASRRPGKEGTVVEMMVREIKNDNYIDIRIAVCGNVDAGKSTIIGVLTSGKLDNGRGLARLGVFNHKHEIDTGRTSSVSRQIMGFNSNGVCVNYDDDIQPTGWGDIIDGSHKIISFFDLAGHEKYLKTTVSGMMGEIPDYCLLMVGANMGVTKMTREHIGLAVLLKIPIIVIVTKIDIAPNHILKKTLEDINKMVKGLKKICMPVESEYDCTKTVKLLQSDRIVPIFKVSSVTGENIDLLRSFMNLLKQRIKWDTLKDSDESTIMVSEKYNVNGVGTVVGGTVLSGKVSIGQVFNLGPDGNGNFQTVQIKSIHIKRRPTNVCYAGASGGFAFRKVKNIDIRRGMILSSKKINVSRYFVADILIMSHSTTIKEKYESVIQCLMVRQSASLVHIYNDKGVLRAGDKARVIFRFEKRPEYLKVGTRLVMREGKCKGIGIVREVSLSESDVNEIRERKG